MNQQWSQFSTSYCRHATISWGKSIFFQWKSVSIRILHLCIDVSRKRSRDSYRDAVCKKKSNKNRQPAANKQNRSFNSRGATVGLGLRLWLTSSIVFLFGNLAEKASCVDDKNCFVSLHIHKLFFSNLTEIHITTWYGRIFSKKAKIRIGYGQSVPGGMSAIDVCWSMKCFWDTFLLSIQNFENNRFFRWFTLE